MTPGLITRVCNCMTVSGGQLYNNGTCPVHPKCTCPPVTATATGATCAAHGPQPMVWINTAAAV